MGNEVVAAAALAQAVQRQTAHDIPAVAEELEQAPNSGYLEDTDTVGTFEWGAGDFQGNSAADGVAADAVGGVDAVDEVAVDAVEGLLAADAAVADAVEDAAVADAVEDVGAAVAVADTDVAESKCLVSTTSFVLAVLAWEDHTLV